MYLKPFCHYKRIYLISFVASAHEITDRFVFHFTSTLPESWTIVVAVKTVRIKLGKRFVPKQRFLFKMFKRLLRSCAARSFIKMTFLYILSQVLK